MIEDLSFARAKTFEQVLGGLGPPADRQERVDVIALQESSILLPRKVNAV